MAHFMPVSQVIFYENIIKGPKMINAIHTNYSNLVISNAALVDFWEPLHQIPDETSESDTLPPISLKLRSMELDDIEISEEFRFFFDTIIGDFEKSLDESYDWIRSRPAAA